MEGTEYETPVYINDSGVPGPVAMIVGGQHGIEPAGWMSAAHFATAPIDRGTVIVIPYACQPAIEQQRYLPHQMGTDLNGHWPPDEAATHPLAREIWHVADEYGPEVYVDAHSSSGIYSEDTGVGQCIFPTSSGRDAAERVAGFVNEYCMDRAERYNWTIGNTQGDQSETTLIDRVGWLVAKPGYIVESTRAGTSLDERAEWEKVVIGRLLRENGICVGY